MNLRCAFCQTPYAIGRTEILAALQHLESENLAHYDAHCPRCRRATQVQRQKLEMALPNWREELKEAVNQPAPEVTSQPAAPVAQVQQQKSAAPTPVEKSPAKPAAKAPAKAASKPAAPAKAASKTPAKPAKTPVSKKTQATKAGTSKPAPESTAKKKKGK